MFVLGYGLHLADLYRNVPRVVRGRPPRRPATTPAPTSPRSTARDGCRRRAAKEAGARVAADDPEAPVIPMSLVGVRVEVPSNQPIVLLRENEGQRYLPIFIGPARGDRDRLRAPGHGDAPADDPRPLQDRARRPRRQGASRSSSPSCTTARSTPRSRSPATSGTYRISSRPSDAIALAVRYGEPVPIFANEDVLEEAGVLFEQDEDEAADRAVPGVPRPGAPRGLRPRHRVAPRPLSESPRSLTRPRRRQ